MAAERASLPGWIKRPGLRERIVGWLIRRSQVVGLVLLGAAVFGLVIWGYANWRERTELRASAALTVALRELDSAGPVSEGGGAGAGGKTGAETLQPLLDRLTEVAESYAGTVGGEQAKLEIGNRLFGAGRYEEALQSFQAYLEGVRGGRFTFLAGLGKGYALEALGRHGEAAKVFESLSAGRDTTGQILAAEALMGLARNQMKLRRFQEAKETYQRVQERYPGSSWAYVAEREVIFLDR